MSAIVFSKTDEAASRLANDVRNDGRQVALYTALFLTAYGIEDYEFEIKMFQNAYLHRDTGRWIFNGAYVQRSQVYRRLTKDEVIALADWYLQLP